MRILLDWFRRMFADPQVVSLSIFLLLIFSVIYFMGNMLAPVLGSVVLAYLLQGIVAWMERHGSHHLFAVSAVFLLFVLLVFLILVVLMPLLYRQVTELIQQLPAMLSQGQRLLMQLPERYPELMSEAQVVEVYRLINSELAQFGQRVLSTSLASVFNLIAVVVYLILVPLLVFFFLKDKSQIMAWFRRFLPDDYSMISRIWQDVDRQLANYVRGKFWEILVVWFASFVTFTLLGLDYAMLLSVLVGLSVVVPYIGAAVVTFPVLIIAWFQWGWSGDFAQLAIAYFVIQALDGNVLVPLLFSEVVNLHPVAIIVAILVFGGFWGFWGVFFAIPLATVVQAVLSALWANRAPPEEETSSAAENPQVTS